MKTQNNYYRFITVFITFFGISMVYGQKEMPSGDGDPSMAIAVLKQWETAKVFQVPESVYYDQENDLLYVANINGKPTAKDGNGFISTLSSKGQLLEKKWIDGLDAPKGMGIHDGKLYVSNIDELVEVSIKKRKIIKRYKADNGKFLNDIDVNQNGIVYVSDMQTSSIYTLKNGEFSLWFQDKRLHRVNGLYCNNDYLAAGTSKNILKIDYETGEIDVYIKNTGGIDGIKEFAENDFLISDWQGKVQYVSKTAKTLLFDHSDKKINAADIEYDKKSNMLYVPTFFDNRVMAYSLEAR